MENYNRKAHDLAELVVGNHVLIQHPLTKQWSTTGIVVELGPNRDYLIKTEAGRVYRRNRRFLRRRIVVMPGSAEPPPAVPDEPQPEQPPPEQPQPGPPEVEHPEAEQPAPRRSTREKRRPNKYPSTEWLVDN